MLIVSILIVLLVLMVSDQTSNLNYYCSIYNTIGSIPLSPLSYSTMRSNVFNRTQPSNEGCTNGVIVSGQVTTDCGQGTTLIDCDRGYNDNVDYSDLSNYFIWSGTELLAQQVSIVFRFYQQIKISKITMFFWNSPSISILIPNVRMFWSDYFDGSIIINRQITNTNITTDLRGRTGDGQRRLNIDINDNINRLQFQYLRIEMSFYDDSEWIFLGEVQFCGE